MFLNNVLALFFAALWSNLINPDQWIGAFLFMLAFLMAQDLMNALKIIQIRQLRVIDELEKNERRNY